MTEEKIIEVLERSNKWWKGKYEFEFRPREIYEEIKKYVPKKQIVALIGLRRTGKTTIMFKIIEDSFTILPKENIVYFSFDEFKDIRLIEVVNAYARSRNKNMEEGEYLFLLDEVQKVENWEEQLKRLYDENKNIKFIISGSESLFIRKKSRESLAGRMYEFQINTLTFREYLSFRDKKFKDIGLNKEEILREFNKFLICNGFPEIIDEDKEASAKYIKENVIEKIIYKDIPQMVPIQDPAFLEGIFRTILEDPGQIINRDELSKEFGLSRQTISLYLDYLEKSFLIKKLYNFSKNARKTQRRFKKYYPTIISPDIIDKREIFGKIFETFMVNQLKAEFFWRDTSKNEVDIIKLEPLIAIEIKSGEIKERDLKSLNKFSEKFKPEHSIVISYNTRKEIESIKVIPFYMYLLQEAI